MKKILLISRFNVPNIGDLAISSKLVDILSSHGKVDKMNLLGAPYKFIDINNIEENNYSKKFKIMGLLKKYKLDFLYNIYRNLKNGVYSKKIDSFSELADNINDYNLIVIGGGNMLMSLNDNFSTVKRFGDFVEIAIENNKPIFAMDIGIGPFYNKNHAEIAIKSLNKCTKITFRDKKSYDLFLDLGGDEQLAEVSVDPVFLYKHELKSATRKNQVVAINIIDSTLFGKSDQENKYFIEGYTQLINELTQREVEVTLFTTSKEDESVLEDVYHSVNDKSKISKANINGLDDLISLYKGIDLLIGTRMHSMIIAYTLQTPMVGFSWQAKVDAFFNLIDEENFVFSFDNMVSEQEKILESTFVQLKNSSYYRERKKKKLNEIRSKSEVNNEILNSLFY